MNHVRQLGGRTPKKKVRSERHVAGSGATTADVLKGAVVWTRGKSLGIGDAALLLAPFTNWRATRGASFDRVFF